MVTLFAAYQGEDYADIPTVQRTVGFIPPATRAEREERTLAVSDMAAALGVPGIATHVGFVPEDTRDEHYIAVREMVRRVCDHAAKHGQTFALETGQESADTLLDFFIDVNRENLRINFDPANMILYGTGDPIAALERVAAARGDGPLQRRRLAAEERRRRAGHGAAAGPGRGRDGALHRQAEGDPLQRSAVHRKRSARKEERARDIQAGVALLQKLV